MRNLVFGANVTKKKKKKYNPKTVFFCMLLNIFDKLPSFIFVLKNKQK